MTPDQWFVVASQSAIAGWILLAVGLFVPRPWAGRVLFFGVGDQLAPNRKAVP